MPRRRDPRIGADGAPPAELLQFQLQDWPVTRAEPVWWQDRCPNESWPLQWARREWTRQRAEWARSQPSEAAAWQVLHGPVD